MTNAPISLKGIRPFGTNDEGQLFKSDKKLHEGWTLQAVARSIRRQWLLGTVVVLLLTGALSIAVGTALGLANFRDVGFPDSATLLRVGEFVRSGHIYPDIHRPPYYVTLYGPLTYIMLAAPYKLAQVFGITPQVLVRLMIVGALCVCVLLTFLVSRRLYSSRPIAWICALFAISALPMALWTTQIRGDFLALAFSLLSVYCFLLTNGRPRGILSAVFAAIGLLVKQTFVAAPLAIICWLVYRRRFKEAVFWATGFALTVLGGYAIVWWREPLLSTHLAALRHPILDYRSALPIIWHAVAQPVVPFAVIGSFLALWKPTPEKILLLIYCAVAWLVAIFTIPQVGGNINYFWEPLFASAVLAGWGLYEFQRETNRTPALVAAMLLFLLFRSSLPILRQELDYLKLCYVNLTEYQLHKTRWESFVSAVSGRRLLSTLPEITLHSETPEIPDPYLNSVLELGGQWDSSPIAAQIDAGVYDLVVIEKGEAEARKGDGYRGVRGWSEGMWGALKRAYGPACVFEGMEVWLPHRGSEDIRTTLAAIGCLGPTKQVDNASSARATGVSDDRH